MKLKRKRVNSSLKRGRAAEQRLVSLLHLLRSHVPWIGCVRLAGKKHDRLGIDVFVSIKPLTGEKHIVVPVQVKSSLCGLIEHFKKYSHTTAASSVAIMVNDYCTDKDIQLRLIKLLTKVRES
jgi:hypothetical protein